MILPEALSHRKYIFDDAPYGLEEIVRFCMGKDEQTIKDAFGLDKEPPKTGKSMLTNPQR